MLSFQGFRFVPQGKLIGYWVGTIPTTSFEEAVQDGESEGVVRCIDQQCQVPWRQLGLPATWPPDLVLGTGRA